MTRRWMLLAVVLSLVLPSALYARWIKDKVYLQTDQVGKVKFSHYTHNGDAFRRQELPDLP